jgi:hypothetical protein
MLASRSAELSRLIEEKAKPIVNEFSTIGNSAAEKIVTAAQQSANLLVESNSGMAQLVEQAIDDYAKAGSDAANRLVAATRQSTTMLTETHSGMANVVTGAVDDLNVAVARASQEFKAADQSLSTAASSFSDSASRAADMVSSSSRLLEGKIDRLSNISGQTLSQVAGIVGRFEEHSSVLSQASELLNAAQTSLVGTLEERQEALRTLSVGLLTRSEEIENSMRGVMGVVEQTLAQAEQRSANVAGNLRNNLSASFDDIGRSLDETEQRANAAAQNMRGALQSAGEDASRSIEGTMAEAQKYSDALVNRLRGGVAASLSDVDKLLGNATDKSNAAANSMRETLREAVEEAVQRFAGATDEIRRSSLDIRTELDSTRAELKRGAFDLPEEAKESAAAMRRAVSEQIKALQDISQLVGRSTQQLEISEPAARAIAATKTVAPAQPQQPRVEQPRAEQQRPGEPTAVAAPSAPVISSPALQQPAAQQPRASAPAEARSVPQQPSITAAPVQRREDGGGWISDLLRGASRDGQDGQTQPAPAPRQAAEPQTRAADARNPRHVVESLNSLSVDIARAIDHDASVELWGRYQRGERDVFTRRLYTLKGQQTFDEIKRKYEREVEFRTAVDRYISDFEKLLADVARTDRDRTITQSYLTSDTGKVYTMLAHAAGRFS